MCINHVLALDIVVGELNPSHTCQVLRNPQRQKLQRGTKIYYSHMLFWPEYLSGSTGLELGNVRGYTGGSESNDFQLCFRLDPHLQVNEAYTRLVNAILGILEDFCRKREAPEDIAKS